MDAQRLGFADAFFDVVLAQYIMTVVPDSERPSTICSRRPVGGEIIPVNRGR